MQRTNTGENRYADAPAPRRASRTGAALVEFAVVAPVFFLMVFGLLEFGRMVMCYQVMTNASREAARAGTVPGSTSADVMNAAEQVLAAGYVNGATVTVNPTNVGSLNQGDTFTVTAQVPFDQVSWLPVPQWLGGKTLQASASMTREGN